MPVHHLQDKRGFRKSQPAAIQSQEVTEPQSDASLSGVATHKQPNLQVGCVCVCLLQACLCSCFDELAKEAFNMIVLEVLACIEDGLLLSSKGHVIAPAALHVAASHAPWRRCTAKLLARTIDWKSV